MSGNIAYGIGKIIDDKCLKQSAVAKKAGFTPQQFNDMVKGRKLILAEYMPSIADALGVGVMDIYNAGIWGKQMPAAAEATDTREGV